jgi:hypothetical protein
LILHREILQMPKVNIKGVGVAQFPDDMPINDIRNFLRNKYSQGVISGQSDILSPVQNVAAPYEPTLVERMGTGIADTLKNTGVISDNYGAQRIGKNIAGIGEFLPGVGDATAGDEFGRAVAEGDGFGIGIAALGAVPVAGDLAKKASKSLTRVTHGSSDVNFTGEIKKGGLGNLFDGVFASRGDVSEYGGVKQVQYDIDEDKIMAMGDSDVDYDSAIDFIKKEYPDADEDVVNDLYEIIAEDQNVFDMSSNPLEQFGFDDLGEASWEGQRLRGKLAKDQGFDAVEMSDEFGASILIPYGSNAKKVNGEQ